MKQKRTIYSLLLTSFVLVFAFASLNAQTVSFESKSVLRCQPNELAITVDNGSDISAFEVVFDVTSGDGAGFSSIDVEWDMGLAVLTNRIVDLSGFDMVTGLGTVRIAGMLIDNGDACLGSGSTVVGKVVFNTMNVCSGTIDIVGGSFACENSSVTATTQFVDCATNEMIPATVTPGAVTITNTAPTVEVIPDGSLAFGETFVQSINATDPDEASCEVLSYSVTGPDGMSVNANGLITWPTDGADVCTHTVEVIVSDACGETATTSFDICVTNEAPTLAADGDVEPMIWGSTASGTVTGADADGGPSPLLYSVDAFDGAGSIDINPATGAWSWETDEDNAYVGCFTLTIKVTDGANVCEPCSPSNSATVNVEICVIPTIRVTIEKTHLTLQGHSETVSVYLDDAINPANEIGGYNFLIKYDASVLSFNSALPGQLLEDCGWEYFTYRYGSEGNCAGGCPSGVLRVVAIAEYNNGEFHPGCFISGNGQLAELSFLVTNDRTMECQYVPIRFIWFECADNAISSVSGDTLFISRKVYDYMLTTGELTDANSGYPTYTGAQDADCFVGDPVKVPLRLIDYKNGGIDIACADELDARGDVNLNEIGYEIADAVLFTNYFVYGLGVFVINVEGQIAATDVNADGLSLSVADLVYLTRVVVGDALPYPKELAPVAATYSHTSSGLLNVDNINVGGAYVVVSGNTTPELMANNMEMKYNFDGVNTRVLVYSFTGESFTGQFLNVSGNILEIEMATDEGYPVAAKEIPTEFALMQNYPNPFNPSTTLSFDLPKASDVSLTIYNINGQQVANFSGNYDAGTVSIDWDATSHASGVYFYKLQAGQYSDTKKMVLLK